MEEYSLFGIPYPLIGFFCFILAAVFYFVWPKSRAKELSTLNFPKLVLQRFQSLAWVLFGMAAFMQKGFPNLAVLLIGLGGLAYFMFFYFLLRR